MPRRLTWRFHASYAVHARNTRADPTSPAAQLVGMGFRLCLAGHKSCDSLALQKVHDLYVHHLGSRQGAAGMAELTAWVQAVDDSSQRQFKINQEGCQGFCQDECLAIAMIAACQHKICPAMRACAFALIESSSVQRVIDQSEQFAMTLVGVRQVLPPSYVINAAAFSGRRDAGYLQ